MEYTAEYDKINSICIVYVSGKHRRPLDSIILQKFVSDFNKSTYCNRFLIDYIKAKIITTTLDSFKAGTMPYDTDRRMVGIKIALLFTGEMTDHKFMEDVAYNRGYQVKVFDDREQAMAWLIPQENPRTAVAGIS